MRVKIRKENKFERSKRIKKLGGACAEFFTLHIEQKKISKFFYVGCSCSAILKISNSHNLPPGGARELKISPL